MRIGFRETEFVRRILMMSPRTDKERQARLIVLRILQESNAADRFYVGSHLPLVTHREASGSWRPWHHSKGEGGHKAYNRSMSMYLRSRMLRDQRHVTMAGLMSKTYVDQFDQLEIKKRAAAGYQLSSNK